MEHVVTLRADFPAKKNRIVARRGSRGHYAGDVGKTITNIVGQLRAAWRTPARGPLPRVESPDFEIRLWVFNPAKDRDGIWTTVLDAMVKAGVLVDDSTRWCNGREVQQPAIIVQDIRDERIEIAISWEPHQEVGYRGQDAKSKRNAK